MPNNKDSRLDRFIQAISFLWLDDKTGKQSDTTLRTWILFFVFVVYTIYVAFFDSEITNADIELLQLLSIAFLGMSGLYLGKRTLVKDVPTESVSSLGTAQDGDSDPVTELQRRGINP